MTTFEAIYATRRSRVEYSKVTLNSAAPVPSERLHDVESHGGVDRHESGARRLAGRRPTEFRTQPRELVLGRQDVRPLLVTNSSFQEQNTTCWSCCPQHFLQIRCLFGHFIYRFVSIR